MHLFSAMTFPKKKLTICRYTSMFYEARANVRDLIFFFVTMQNKKSAIF